MTPAKLVGATETPESSTKAGALVALFSKRHAMLRQFVAEVAQDGDIRERLSVHVREALAREASTMQAELWLLPESSTASARRLALETRLATLTDAHRHEQIACWRDVAQLGRERRAWQKEYLELQQRLALLASAAASTEGYR